MKIHIGFEKGTGDPVDIELSPTSPHIAIFGQTGLGKTVLVRRIIDEIPDDYRILIFDTREGVEEFKSEGHRIPIFIRQTTDSLVLKGLLESIIQSSLKREYATLVRVTEGTKNYATVIHRLDDRIDDKRTHAVVKDMMVLLRDLLRRLVAEMADVPTSEDVDLHPGLNVMSLNSRSKQFKQLAVRAVLPLVYKKYRKLVVFLDEGQEYIPQKYSSAAKESVDDFIRTARGKEDYMVIAAQSITGTDKDPLKQVHTWIMFGQATGGEAKEVLEYTPHSDKMGLKPREIQTMPTGFAIVSTKEWGKRTYIEPTWFPAGVATKIAKGERTVRGAGLEFKPKEEARDMDEEERKKYESEIRVLKDELATQKKVDSNLRDGWRVTSDEVTKLRDELHDAKKVNADLKAQIITLKEHVDSADEEIETPRAYNPEIPAILETEIDIESLAKKVADIIRTADGSGLDLLVKREEPSLTVKVNRPVVKTDDSTIKGKIATLLSEGFFDEPRTPRDLIGAVRSRGWGDWSTGGNNPKMYNELKWFAATYMLRLEEGKYSALPGIKKRIEVVD